MLFDFSLIDLLNSFGWLFLRGREGGGGILLPFEPLGVDADCKNLELSSWRKKSGYINEAGSKPLIWGRWLLDDDDGVGGMGGIFENGNGEPNIWCWYERGGNGKLPNGPPNRCE